MRKFMSLLLLVSAFTASSEELQYFPLKVTQTINPHPAGVLPRFDKFTGFMSATGCNPFATEATAELHKRGIPARKIYYKWTNPNRTWGWHAAVLFQHDGKFWFMDSGRPKPRHVKGKTDAWCVLAVTPSSAMIRMTNEFGDVQKSRKMSKLFPTPPAWMKAIQVGAK